MHKVFKAPIIEKAITSLRSLPKNWDNYNSPAVSYQAINTFETFANRFFKFFYLRYSMTAVSGGGIQVDFNYDKKIITLEIYPDGSIGVEKFERNLVPEHSTLYIDNPYMTEHINELLEWLIK